MNSRIFIKLLVLFMAVIAATSVTLDAMARRSLDQAMREEVRSSLLASTRQFAQQVGHSGTVSISEVAQRVARAAGARATVIDRSGQVLADTSADPEHMENHSTRPEFVTALSGGEGSSVRHSKTVGIDFMYTAVPAATGAVRLALPLSSVQQTQAAVRKALLQATALAVLLALVVAAFGAYSISRRLRRIVTFASAFAAGNLRARVAETGTDEIAQVARALDRSADSLQQSFAVVQAERAQMTALLESIQDGVFALSASRNIEWVNRSLEQMFSGQVRIGSPLVESMRDPAVIDAAARAIEAGQPAGGRATTLLSGKVFEVTATPRQGGGAVIVLHDISAIERVEKTRRDFIANVSHELRTPLTSIQGYTETLLESSALNANDAASLQIIHRHAGRMARLTEDLLTLARVESGELKLQLAPVNAGLLLEEARGSFSAAARAASVALEIVQTTEKPVSADANAIHQVFGNLLTNAFRYGSAGGRVELGAVEGSAVEFFVRDFGRGIASEHLSRLFERFYRVDPARSRDSGGTGLGLAIVKHIILNHGGSVRVQSELNHGSTFYFTLPAA